MFLVFIKYFPFLDENMQNKLPSESLLTSSVSVKTTVSSDRLHAVRRRRCTNLQLLQAVQNDLLLSRCSSRPAQIRYAVRHRKRLNFQELSVGFSSPWENGVPPGSLSVARSVSGSGCQSTDGTKRFCSHGPEKASLRLKIGSPFSEAASSVGTDVLSG